VKKLTVAALTLAFFSAMCWRAVETQRLPLGSPDYATILTTIILSDSGGRRPVPYSILLVDESIPVRTQAELVSMSQAELVWSEDLSNRGRLMAANDVVDGFLARNALPGPLTPSGSESDLWRFIGPVEFHDLTTDCQTGMDRIRAGYPETQMVLRTTQLGTGSDGREALIYIEFWLGGCLGSGGELYKLTRDGGTWRVDRRDKVWVS
jgi:hypothetical protein